MKLCIRLICIHQKKKLSKKGKRRRLKQEVVSRRKTKLRPNPTPIYIPLDLLINILLRLPVKFLLRFRCVSKLWSSIITSRDFEKRHSNIASSLDPSRLLITFGSVKRKELLLVSSPKPYASSSSSSSCCVPYKDLSLLNIPGRKVYNEVRGLFCFGSKFEVGICNPSTGELHIFPRIKFINYPRTYRCSKYFFGYDPVEDQYKVLAIDDFPGRLEHKVMVLGREEAWREAPCVACPHIAHTLGLYMNGTQYYTGPLGGTSSPRIIVSFDVRFETFNMIDVPSKLLPMDCDNFWIDADHGFIFNGGKTLINYRGKIGVLEKPRQGSFRMWVVEDAEKEEWSMKTFHLPRSAATIDYKVKDTFYNSEICLVPKVWSDPFCLFFHNLKTNSRRSVTIEGLPISELKEGLQFHGLASVTILYHYESLVSYRNLTLI